MGGGGGAEGGAEEWIAAEGLREPGGGGGFLPTGGGGGFDDAELAVFLRLAIEGWKVGADGRPGIAGAAPGGGRGAETVGGFGADLDVDSGSERYDESRLAPVSTPPPVFRSFGMPPAKRPPSCGAASMPVDPP